ncbi:hypothetical protein [Aeromonas sp. FDAARGOS 1416]|uniref:hypothetical protein n=1 Tax=Aeromonas TaxID=642 RepID=UPI001C232F97|nr:hypothetical protein [Aeromonas sp. FDAARGOS 1416]QXB03000.1 hypothetical protein I6L46_06485 [Aeromonas sp. FDAARGOS 1416]
MSDNSDFLKFHEKSKAMWAEVEEEIERKKDVEANKEIYSAIMSSNSSYTNLIIVAGYAGYFSLLSVVKDGISILYMLSSAFLILISISTFVIFEVYKMHSVLSHVNKVIISLSNNGCRASQILDAVKREQQRFNLSAMKYWYVCLWVCLLTGLGGVLVLLFALLTSFVRFFFS